MNRKQRIQKRLSEIEKEIDALSAKEDWSKEDRETFGKLSKEQAGLCDDLKAIIDVERVQATLSTGTGRVSEPADPATTSQAALAAQNSGEGATLEPTGAVRDRRLADPKRGYKRYGEFLSDVIAGSKPNAPKAVRERLAPTTYGSEGVSEDGGAAVPPEWRQTITEKLQSEDSLMARCDQTTTSSNHVKQPVDFDEDWNNTDGIRVFWRGEAAQMTQSKPKLDMVENPIEEQYALVPLTSELTQDAGSLESMVGRKAPRKMMFNMNLKIIQGSGAGEPLGLINSDALISVAKEGSQVADTVVAANISKMWARLYAPSRRNAVWLINQDVEPQLDKLSHPGVDNTGAAVTGWGTQLYWPPGGLSATPFGTLKGRPVIPTQACATLGDLGDIILADLSQYWIAMRDSGVQADMSVHLWFDYNVNAFRFIFRVGGTPWWPGTLTARAGSATYSPFVALAERA